MEKLSRVKKYEALRKSIEMDNAIDASSHIKEPQTKEVLKTFDTSVFKKIDIVDDDKIAKRAKDEELKKDEEEKDTFTNEYLDDFIKEVREYNIRKGNRESENTEVDILYQLNAANRAKRTHYIQEITDDDKKEDLHTVLSKEEITQQVQKMLLEEPLHEQEESEMSDQDILDDSIQQTNLDLKQAVELVGIHDDQVDTKQKEETNDTIADLYDDLFVNHHTKEVEMNLVDTEEENVIEEADDIIDEQTSQDVLKKKLIAETQQLRVQLDEYEDELTGLSDDLEKNNKLLNFVLCFLIVVLLIIIGFIAYSILRAGGI